MFGLAHRAVLLASAEDAFDHRSTRLRHAIAFVPRGASVDGAPTTLAGCGDAVVLRHMRRNVDGAQMGHMVGRVIGLIFAHCDAAARLLGFGLEHDLKNLEIGALAVFLPWGLGQSGCCEQTLTYAVSSLGMRIR